MGEEGGGKNSRREGWKETRKERGRLRDEVRKGGGRDGQKQERKERIEGRR